MPVQQDMPTGERAVRQVGDVTRVVVTGIGPVTPVGIGMTPFWDALTAGRSGIGPITLFDPSRLNVKVAGEVKGFDPTTWMKPKEARRTDRYVHLAVAAAALAWDDAGGLDVDRARVSATVGTGMGTLQPILDHHVKYLQTGPAFLSPLIVPLLMPNSAAAYVSMINGFGGHNVCVSTACATGAHAVIDAFKTVRDGDATMAVAGGTESLVIEVGIAGFDQARALSRNPDPPRASRPFDLHRDGFVMAEGACVLVLEEARHAEARGARIYAEVAGYGSTADAYHITAPDPEATGAIRAMQTCLDRAGEPPDAVDYVNAHGTSTPLNDVAETRAIKKALGEHAHRTIVSSTKSMTGHMIGAAGAAEAAVAALAVSSGVIPPTINYETPDPECDLDYAPNGARHAEVRFALSNAFAFGGHNAVLAMRRWDG